MHLDRLVAWDTWKDKNALIHVCHVTFSIMANAGYMCQVPHTSTDSVLL